MCKKSDKTFTLPCEYCGKTETYEITWTDNNATKSTHYLCAQCDEDEITSLGSEDDGDVMDVEFLEGLTS